MLFPCNLLKSFRCLHHFSLIEVNTELPFTCRGHECVRCTCVSVCMSEPVRLFYWRTFVDPLFSPSRTLLTRAASLCRVLLGMKPHPVLWPLLPSCAASSYAPFPAPIEFLLFPVPRNLLIHLSCCLCCEGFILLWISLLSFSWSQEKGKTGTPFRYASYRC